MNTIDERISGRELQKAIAELVGYTVKTGYSQHHENYADLFDPSGKWINRYWMREYRDMEGAAWANTPNYASDANAALTLTVEGLALQIRQLHEEINGVSWVAGYHKTPNVSVISASGKTPAEAICHARLALVKYPEPV